MSAVSAIAIASAPPPAEAFARRDIAGVRVAALGQEAAFRLLDVALAEGRHLKLAFCNAHLVNLAAHEPDLRPLLDGFLVLPDGIGVDLGSRLLHGAPFPANLNGTDFIPAFLDHQRTRLRIALLGGRPGVAERAAARLGQAHPQHDFEPLGHGFLDEAAQAALLERLSERRADLLLVAMGNPLQERFIAARLDARHATVAAGVGALFDFLAGEVVRAPEAFRAMRLEWLYRLWLEPGRLWRRYVLGNPAFLLRVAKARLRRGAAR